jgi:hypothetical protein
MSRWRTQKCAIRWEVSIHSPRLCNRSGEGPNDPPPEAIIKRASAGIAHELIEGTRVMGANSVTLPAHQGHCVDCSRCRDVCDIARPSELIALSFMKQTP